MYIYYVYAYINKKTGLPYYIGKGKNNRAYKFHGHITVPKDKSKIVFLETNLSNVGALALERRYIKWFGRKNIDNNGILLNITEGGDGNNGPHSEEAKASMRGRRKPFTKEEKEKKYASRRGPNLKARGPRPNARKPRGPEAALKSWETRRNKIKS